jgi:hypothetical protein
MKNVHLKRLLEQLETAIQPARQAETDRLYQRALRSEDTERIPLSLAYPLPVDSSFSPFPHRELFADPEKMLFNELVHAFETSILHHATVQDDLPFTIRANFGTGVIASLFGARVEQVDDNPPWVRSFESLDAFQRVFDCDPLDFSRGWCPRVVERYEFYRATLAEYPRLNRAVWRVLPDLQGPMDTAEMLRGSEWYEDLVERPAMVNKLLALLAQAQVGFARRLQPLLNDGPPGFCHQHASALAGNILIRNDSAIMISPAMYREQIAPHDEWVLREMGGGGIHSCGNIGHLAAEYLRLPSLRALDLGQPELNDLDSLYALARARKVALIRVDVPEDELVSGRVRERFPTGVTLRHRSASLAAAAQLMARYRGAS